MARHINLNGPAAAPAATPVASNPSSAVVEAYEAQGDPKRTGPVGATAGNDDARKTLHYAAGAIGVALVMLWFMGAIVFKDANLI